MELKEGIKQINQSVTQSAASDATLEDYMLELKDANGNLVDKQPVSKIESLVYNYLATKRRSELAAAVGGDQNGHADGFVKFINKWIDDTIDDITPMGVFPYANDSPQDRGYVFRFYSDMHTRTLEIKVCEKSGMFYRTRAGSSGWAAWKSVGANNMGVLSKSDDLNNIKSPGVYILYTGQHPSNTPSGLLSTTTSLLKVTAGEYLLTQEIYPIAGEPFYRLFYKNNTWYDWTPLSTGIPSFYKNYATIKELEQGARDANYLFFPIQNEGDTYYKINYDFNAIQSGTATFVADFYCAYGRSPLFKYTIAASKMTNGVFYTITSDCPSTVRFFYNANKELFICPQYGGDRKILSITGKVTSVEKIGTTPPEGLTEIPLSNAYVSYMKDYSDIASLAGGLNKTIKTNGGEHIYKIGSINSNYTPFITRIFVSNTDSNKLTEYVAIVGESTSGIAADGNKVYYRLLAGGLHAGKIEIKVADRTIYAVTTGDFAVRFESATEVTGIDLSTAYVVHQQQIN